MPQHDVLPLVFCSTRELDWFSNFEKCLAFGKQGVIEISPG